jgi:hypothetical protein
VFALELRGLGKRYDDGLIALDDFSLSIPEGAFFGLLGPNGAGKTTLISAVCSRLPAPWQEISHANPIFYLVSAVRYGFLGRADAPIGLALGVTAVLAVATVAWSSWLFRTGKRLKA